MSTYQRRKSISKKNPNSHPNRNLPPPPHFNQFVGPKNASTTNHILKESTLESDFFEGTSLWAILNHQGVIDFCSQVWKVSMDRVKWFYNHVQMEYNLGDQLEGGFDNFVEDHLSLYVVMGDGNKIEYKDVDFRRDFDMPCRGVVFYNDQRWPLFMSNFGIDGYEELVRRMNRVPIGGTKNLKQSNHVNREFLNGLERLLLKVMREILIPTNNHAMELTRIEAITLFCLVNSIRINWPVHIAQHMASTFFDKKLSTLSYGSFISHIMGQWDTIAPGAYMEKKGGKITASTISKMSLYKVDNAIYGGWEFDVMDDGPHKNLLGAILNKKGDARRASKRVRIVGEEEEEAEDSDEENPEIPLDPSAGGTSSSAPRRSVNEQLDLLLQQNERMEQTFHRMEYRQERLERRQSRTMAFLKKLGEKLGCKSSDVDELAHSPDRRH